MLSAKAVITAIDHASPVFARVGAAANAAAKRYGNFSATASKLAAPGVLSMAAPSALSLSSFGHNEYEWDKAVHQYRAIVEMSEGAFTGGVGKTITEVSNAIGANRLELLEAAKGWQELGNSPESFIKNVQVAARTSRITGISIAEQMKESSALMRAFGHQVSDEKMFKHFEEVYLVASKGMKGGAHAYGEAMKMWAPVASAVGLSLEEASAMAQTLGGQFQSTEIGNALKTGMLRLAAPVPKSQAAMRAEGIDAADYQKLDINRLRDSSSLIARLRGSGSFTITKDIERLIRDELATVDPSQKGGLGAFQDRFNAKLSAALGGKKMSARDRSILQQSLLQHVGTAMKGIDPDKFFKTFAPMAGNAAFMSIVFGKEHAPKWMDLLKQYEHFHENLEKIKKQSDGALDTKWGIFGQGFAFEFDRLTAAWNNMLGSFGASGIKSDIVGFFQSMSSFLRDAQTMNPDSIRLLFGGLVGLAALPVAGLWLAGAATAISTISAALASPAVLAVIAAGGLAALLGGGDLFKSPFQESDAQDTKAPILKTWDELKNLFLEVSNLATSFGGGVRDIINETRALFGIDPMGSPLLVGLKVINDALRQTASTIREVQQILPGSGITAVPTTTTGKWGLAARVALEALRGSGRSSAYGDQVPAGGLPPLRLLSDIGQSQRVDVQGQAQIENRITIKIDAPDGLNARVTDQSGGRGTVPLNTGKGMSDTGGSAAP